MGSEFNQGIYPLSSALSQIWLKDAVQCIACQMCCHKKCINKCQNSTVCGSAADSALSSSSSYGMNPEFKVTEVGDFHSNPPDTYSDEYLDTKPATGDGHRASLGDFLAQGLKRVNSANNLAIPAIVASRRAFAQSSADPKGKLPAHGYEIFVSHIGLIFSRNQSLAAHRVVPS